MGKASIRRRKKDAAGVSTQSDNPASKKQTKKEEDTAKDPKQEPEEDETLWETFTGHPLIRAVVTVGIPYSLYVFSQILPLQHPTFLSKMTLGIIQLRPVVPIEEERQLLIVGSMSSGTTSMANEFQKKLGLEIVHESSNTMYNFARDGTVSWFHGVRFFDVEQKQSRMRRDNNGVDRKEHMLDGLCGDPFYNNMGFHPKMFRPSDDQCSPPMLHRKVWNECWINECRNLLNSEIGCALVDTNSRDSVQNKSSTCLSPFQTTLHQVRNPLRTIESLVVKYCLGGISGDVQPAFLKFTTSLFPEADHSFSHDSCIEIAAEYLVRYSQELIRARVEYGAIDGYFKIEESSVCDVAKMGGFLDKDAVSYLPSHEKVQSVCNQEKVNSDGKEASTNKIENKKNRINKGRVRLGFKNLHGGMYGSLRKDGDDTLEKQVRLLFREFGYDESLESDFILDPDESLEMVNKGVRLEG